MNQKDYSTPLGLKNIQVNDEFWHREQELVRTQVIPYQWDALNDRIQDAAPSYCMRNFRTAGAMMREKKEKGFRYTPPSYTFRGFEALPEDPDHPEEDRFYGFVFQDSDFSKWIEAVGYSLAQHPDPELERTADEAIEIVCAAQLENGYLDTYYIINGMDRAFTNLRDHHELYCFGHLAEGAVAYYQATGKDKLLKAAMGYGDYINACFGPEEGKCKGYPGHEIAEMALVRLYEVTGEEKYLNLSRFFLDMRGTQPYYFDREDEERAKYENRPYKPNQDPNRYGYHQAHKPVREQDEAVGHAVRGVYLYSGMADVARLTGDAKMFEACERLWNSITNEKMYITGGIGATHVGEAYSFPYDLPNDTAYSETCAAIGLVFFARRMLEMKADSKYADVMERALYNGVLSGMALDGKSFFYVNPLEVVPEACIMDSRKSHVKHVRQKWFGCACCPPNIARMISSVSDYAYTQQENTLWVHLYMGSTLNKQVGDKTLKLQIASDFPWNGKVEAKILSESSVNASIAFRLPVWCREAKAIIHKESKEHDTELICRVNKEGSFFLENNTPGQEGLRAGIQDGYLYLDSEWNTGDKILLDLPMEIRLEASNPRVRENAGKVAYTRGPLVYCLEEADNGGELHLCKADTGVLSEGGVTDLTKAFQETSVKETFEMGHRMALLKVPGKREIFPGEAENDSKAPSSEIGKLYREYQSVTEKDIMMTLVPYYAWNNRGSGEMTVWIRRD